jgi:[protein-PII] uridylyltransferase
MAGTLSLEERLAERARAYRHEKKTSPPNLVAMQITVDNNASASATVVEIRAEDVVGQLHRITRALGDCKLDVISAKVSTFGPAVVDAFYVRGPDGTKLTDARTIADIEEAVRHRIIPPVPA